MAKITNSMVIGGKLCSKGSAGQIELIEPATEKVWNQVPIVGKKEVDEALEAAARAFTTTGWSAANPAKRIEVLYKLANLIRENAEELAVL